MVLSWSAFRLFLVNLADDDLIRVDRQFRHEVATRQEFEQNITRLFFSSLPAADLQTAREAIRAERRARILETRPHRRPGKNTAR
jgi:hypothetical protein